MKANSDFTELRGRDPHVVLGVDRGVRHHEVIRAYRRAARGGHPDAGGDAHTFRQLTCARDVLLDPRRRAAYNEARRSAGMEPVDEQPSTPAATTWSHRRGPAPTHTSAGDGARTTTTTPLRSPRTSGADASPWAAIAVVLVLIGPLGWPVAIVAACFAMLRTKSSGDGGGKRSSGVLGALFIISIFVLPSLLAFALVLII